MTLDEGASFEITSRWPEYKQRNAVIIKGIYGEQYLSNMAAGIQLVRDRHAELKRAGATSWSSTKELTDLLDSLKL